MVGRTHDEVLDGAHGVWTDGTLVAVWHGGYTLNVYDDRAGGWQAVGCSEWGEQPTREDVAEQARAMLQDGGA